VFPRFTDVQAAPLDSDLEKEALSMLINEIGIRLDVLQMTFPKKTTTLMVIISFLIAATKLFEKDLHIVAKKHLSGSRGNGLLDFSVHSRKIPPSYALIVTGGGGRFRSERGSEHGAAGIGLVNR
jgi:hypothetical protein